MPGGSDLHGSGVDAKGNGVLYESIQTCDKWSAATIYDGEGYGSDVARVVFLFLSTAMEMLTMQSLN